MTDQPTSDWLDTSDPLTGRQAYASHGGTIYLVTIKGRRKDTGKLQYTGPHPDGTEGAIHASARDNEIFLLPAQGVLL